MAYQLYSVNMRLAALFIASIFRVPCMLYRLSMFFLLIFIMYIPRSDRYVRPSFSSHLTETSESNRFNSSISDLPVSIPPQIGTTTSLSLNSEKELLNPDFADRSVNPGLLVNSYLTKISSGSSSQIMSIFLCLLLYLFISSAMNQLKSSFLLIERTFLRGEFWGPLSVSRNELWVGLRLAQGLYLLLVLDLLVCDPRSLRLCAEQVNELFSGGKLSLSGLSKLYVKSSLISLRPLRINQSPSSIIIQLYLIICASLDFFPNTQSTLQLTTSSGKSGYFFSITFLKVSSECSNGFIYRYSSSRNYFGYLDQVNLKIQEQKSYFFWEIYFQRCLAMQRSQGPDSRIGLYMTCWQSILIIKLCNTDRRKRVKIKGVGAGEHR